MCEGNAFSDLDGGETLGWELGVGERRCFDTRYEIRDVELARRSS